jgi:hypothetical protein
VTSDLLFVAGGKIPDSIYWTHPSYSDSSLLYSAEGGYWSIVKKMPTGRQQQGSITTKIITFFLSKYFILFDLI